MLLIAKGFRPDGILANDRLSPELQAALERLQVAIESVSGRIREYNERIEALAQ